MMTAKKYEVAVIVINYNSAKYTIDCIKTIVEKTNQDLNFEIIVVENASQKEDIDFLETELEKLKLSNFQYIKSDINTGFGGGNMLGVAVADANYYAFVNNDSVFLNDCLSIMISEMKQRPEIGICGPMCFKEDGSLLPTLDHFASPLKEFFGRKFLEKINPTKYPNRKEIYTQPQRGQFVAGSFMLVKSFDFETVGGFDPNIFLYYEETDLCKRLANINKFAYLIPDAKFVHYHGISTPKSIAIKTELKISYLYLIKKHYSYIWHFVLLNKLRIQYFFKSVFKPKYWAIWKVLMKGGGIKYSLRNSKN
jgi:hypothetical protein